MFSSDIFNLNCDSLVKTLVSNDYKLLNGTLAVCGWVALCGLAQHQNIGRMSITPANLQNPSPLVQNSMHRCGGVSDYGFFIGRCRAIVLRGQLLKPVSKIRGPL